MDLERYSQAPPGAQRVAFVLAGLAAGGTERVVTRLAAWLTVNEPSIYPIIVTLDDSEADFYDSGSVPRIRLWPDGRPAKERARTLAHLRDALTRIDPDVVIAMGSFAAVSVLAVSPRRRWMVVVSEQNEASRRVSRAVAIARPILYHRAVAGVALTERAAASMRSWLRHAPIVSIGNAVDPNAVTESITGSRAARILAVGSLTQQKGHDVLVRAFAAAQQKGMLEDWRLRIVGEGPLRQNLERLVERLGVGDHVELPGTKRDIAAEYGSAAIFALPSRWEGFGLVVIEAMANGLPVIATRVQGPSAIITTEVDGLLVTPDDVSQLRDALIRVASDHALRRALSKNATRSAAMYAEDRVFPQWVQVIEDAAAGAG